MEFRKRPDFPEDGISTSRTALARHKDMYDNMSKLDKKIGITAGIEKMLGLDELTGGDPVTRSIREEAKIRGDIIHNIIQKAVAGKALDDSDLSASRGSIAVNIDRFTAESLAKEVVIALSKHGINITRFEAHLEVPVASYRFNIRGNIDILLLDKLGNHNVVVEIKTKAIGGFSEYTQFHNGKISLQEKYNLQSALYSQLLEEYDGNEPSVPVAERVAILVEADVQNGKIKEVKLSESSRNSDGIDIFPLEHDQSDIANLDVNVEPSKDTLSDPIGEDNSVFTVISKLSSLASRLRTSFRGKYSNLVDAINDVIDSLRTQSPAIAVTKFNMMIQMRLRELELFNAKLNTVDHSNITDEELYKYFEVSKLLGESINEMRTILEPNTPFARTFDYFAGPNKAYEMSENMRMAAEKTNRIYKKISNSLDNYTRYKIAEEAKKTGLEIDPAEIDPRNIGKDINIIQRVVAPIRSIGRNIVQTIYSIVAGIESKTQAETYAPLTNYIKVFNSAIASGFDQKMMYGVDKDGKLNRHFVSEVDLAGYTQGLKDEIERLRSKYKSVNEDGYSSNREEQRNFNIELDK